MGDAKKTITAMAAAMLPSIRVTMRGPTRSEAAPATRFPRGLRPAFRVTIPMTLPRIASGIDSCRSVWLVVR